MREARTPEPFERLGYGDPGYDRPDAKFELLDGDVDFADGIHLFHTPGHTVGHYSMLVELENGRPLLFMADVSYTASAFAADQQAGFHYDPVAGVRSIRRVKRLAKEWGAEVIFNHDSEAFKDYALAPEPFVGSRSLSAAGGVR